MKIWFDDISILYDKDHIYDLIPSTQDITSAENLNRIVRLSVIWSLMAVLYTRKISYLYIIPVVSFLTIIMYKENNVKEYLKQETDTDEKLPCREPEESNTQMNPNTVADYAENKEYGFSAACNVSNKDIKKRRQMLFNKEYYQDINDVFERKNMERQFYTVPASSVPNDQNAFAEALYGGKKFSDTCKTNTKICLVRGIVKGNTPVVQQRASDKERMELNNRDLNKITYTIENKNDVKGKVPEDKYALYK